MQLMVFCNHNRLFLRMWQLVRCKLGLVVERVVVGKLEQVLVGTLELERGTLELELGMLELGLELEQVHGILELGLGILEGYILI